MARVKPDPAIAGACRYLAWQRIAVVGSHQCRKDAVARAVPWLAGRTFRETENPAPWRTPAPSGANGHVSCQYQRDARSLADPVW